MSPLIRSATVRKRGNIYLCTTVFVFVSVPTTAVSSGLLMILLSIKSFDAFHYLGNIAVISVHTKQSIVLTYLINGSNS